MTVEQTTGAVSHNQVGGWHSIDWQTAHENVRRLQARIVKATQAGKWGKVKALQRLLTRSYSAKVIAVKRVTENRGKHTPGVDGEIWDTPTKKMTAVHNLQQHGYKAQPLRRTYIPKRNGKQRPLGIPTLHDRAMQALYLLALEPVAEVTGDRNSYGFRKERRTADAIEQCFKVFSQPSSATWVLEGDIKACFDEISHEWLLRNIPIERSILQKWLQAGYMEKDALYATEAGTPQGGIISPVLANMTLDGLEAFLYNHYPKTTRRGGKAKLNFIRYADDFVISGSSKELLENEIQPLVEQFLQERALELSPQKTIITHIYDGFDFLGQNIRKYDNNKLLIKPSQSSVKRFLDRIRDIIKSNKHMSPDNLIMRLNPIIRGWALYHQHVVSKAIFSKIDYAIFHAIWQWAKRRHPKKSARWVKQKYFKTYQGRTWVFFGHHNSKLKHIFFATTIPIRRHTKIRGDANPFDPEWEVYFEKRLRIRMLNNLNKRKQLVRLWKDQDGFCPTCQQKITDLTGWHIHHIVKRSLGGSESDDNLVLLHPNCHQMVHSQDLYVEKPRSHQSVRKA
jgi:RNA-directed DNA polymerase